MATADVAPTSELEIFTFGDSESHARVAGIRLRAFANHTPRLQYCRDLELLALSDNGDSRKSRGIAFRGARFVLPLRFADRTGKEEDPADSLPRSIQLSDKLYLLWTFGSHSLLCVGLFL
jgi:hypothetical protein